MSNMYGADVAELRRLSAEFHAAATELDRDGGMMTRLLNSVDWVGGVASRFTNQWTGVQLPRIGLSTRFLREAGDELSRNADQQERASRSIGGAALGRAAMSSPATSRSSNRTSSVQTSQLGTVGSRRLDSVESREAVLRREAGYLDNSTLAQRYPAASARAKAWLAQLLAGDPTPGQVAAFEAYMGALKFAAVQEVWIERAGAHAFEQLVEAAKAGAGATASALKLGGSAVLGEDYALGWSIFEEVLGGVGEFGAEIGVNAMATPEEVAAMGGEWAVARYRADTDRMLAALEDSFREIDHVGHMEPISLARLWNDATGAEVEQAVQRAELAESFTILTGDGSPIDIALRAGLSVSGDFLTAGMASKALDGLAVFGGGAKAGYHLSSATMCLDVVGQGVDNILNAYDVFARTPVTE
jgi:hypothetical protein